VKLAVVPAGGAARELPFFQQGDLEAAEGKVVGERAAGAAAADYADPQGPVGGGTARGEGK
jgi:hypothetical protein